MCVLGENIMQIIRKDKNKESTYEIVYDEETIRTLINEIINNCSFRRNQRCCVEARTFEDAKVLIDSTVDWNGNKIYENVNDIRAEEINDPFDYWRHGDPRPFSFSTDVLISPELVQFLIKIINGEQIDYEWFESRKELTFKQDKQAKIQLLDSQINEVSNFDTERKIGMLQILAIKVKTYNDIPVFDNSKLSKYYDIAESYIVLDLIQETIKHQRKLTPKRKVNN